MSELLTALGEAVFLAAGLFWKALWALAFGYAFSAAIQVFVSRRGVAEHLGDAGPRRVGLAMLFGAVSSSCSFAALSATRSLFAKGAHLIPALAFLFASTNLVIELGVLLWIFLGWQFVLALYVGAFILVAVMAVTVRLTYPSGLVNRARQRAAELQEGDEPEDDRQAAQAWTERLREREAWASVGRRFVAEWRMVWKELFAGFLLAGAVAALVPEEALQSIFPQELPALLLVPLHALLGPVLALVTVIGSMGNGPLAAILWQNGVLFAGILAFLYADFVVIPSLRINARYYGWRFALYLAAIFTASAVVAGVVVHALFALVGLIPERRGDIRELATFGLDYTLVLNVLALTVAGVLVWLARATPGQRSTPAVGAA